MSDLITTMESLSRKRFGPGNKKAGRKLASFVDLSKLAKEFMLYFNLVCILGILMRKLYLVSGIRSIQNTLGKCSLLPVLFRALFKDSSRLTFLLGYSVR
jgi:hypothetical protein